MSFVTNPDDFIRDEVPAGFQSGLYIPVSETISRFHLSEAPTRFIFGPFGSSKSVSCMMELFRRGCEQIPFNGRRRTRFVVVRDTYRNLANTTIKTWREAFDTPKGALGNFVWSPIPKHELRFPLPDGSIVDCEVIFLALDKEEDVEKLKSFEVTGFYLNEMSGLPAGLLGIMSGRFRFPKMAEGGPTWKGIIGDTNGVPEGHWVHEMFEVSTPEGCEIFKQPPAVFEIAPGKYTINTRCDNYHNLPPDYYETQMIYYTRAEIICYLGVGYATLAAGQPVHPDYVDDIHSVDFNADPRLPIHIGLDWGLTPAAALIQIRADGYPDIIHEVTNERADARELAQQVARLLKREYPNFEVGRIIGDPSGTSKSPTDITESCFGVFQEEGFKQARPCDTNDPVFRRMALSMPLREFGRGGKPMVRVHKRNCPMIRAGLAGKFQYKKLKGRENVYDDSPEKNSYSHIIEALEYICFDFGFARDIKNVRRGSRVVGTAGIGSFNPNARD